jgi:hypothetical protein
MPVHEDPAEPAASPVRLGLVLHRIEDPGRVPEAIARIALEKREGGGVVLVLHGREEEAERVRAILRREAGEDEGTSFLVCGPAQEVGMELRTGHLVCDLTTLDGMVRRFGLLAPQGGRDATIDIVHREIRWEAEARPIDRALALTLALLRTLPLRPDGRQDASPRAIAKLRAEEREAASAPTTAP